MVMLCLACGENHLYEGSRCILDVGDIVWRRPGAADPPLLPPHIPAYYYGEGCYVSLNKSVPANIVFYDVDVCEAHTPEYLLTRAFAPEADYIVSVIALGAIACLAARDRCICGILKRVEERKCVVCVDPPPPPPTEEEEEDKETNDPTVLCAGGGGG